MSYTFLLEQGEESSAEFFSDIPAYALSRLNPTAEKCYCSVSGMEFYRTSQSGTTFAPSMADLGEIEWTLFAGDFRARMLAQAEAVRESMENKVGFIENSSELGMKFDRSTCSWKTHHCLWEEDLSECSVILPKSGMMLDGVFFLVVNWGGCICENESGFSLPTIGANEYKGSSKKRFIGSPDFRGAKMSEGLRTCESDPIYLNPSFGELVMMWPLGWTDCTPLETDKFREWLRTHLRH